MKRLSSPIVRLLPLVWLLGFLLYGCEDDTATRPDNTPPAAVTDLVATPGADATVLLTWSAPGDDGSSGTASLYEILYNNSPDTSSAWWESPCFALDTPRPKRAGSSETFLVTDLESVTPHSFLLRTADEDSNWSGWSNVAACTTTATPDTAAARYDAQILAMEISWELLPPPELVAQVDVDLAAIRAEYPYLWSIHVRPDWLPDKIKVRLTQEAIEEYLVGEFHGLDSLNALYGVVEMVCGEFCDRFRWLTLTFQRMYHADLMSEIYEGSDDVEIAQSISLGGDGDDIDSAQQGPYDGTFIFRRAWGDCPRGCIFEHTWILQVTGGEVELLEESGDPIPCRPDD